MKVFPGYKFYPLAQLSQNVPILTCGAISKRLVNSLVILLKVSFEIELCGKNWKQAVKSVQLVARIILWEKLN